MTVILVLVTFLGFIVVDYMLNRRKAIDTVPAEALRLSQTQTRPDYVDGFLVPEKLSYHPGHAWLMQERKNVVRVGADEFAAALLGRLEKIELPKPGQWIDHHEIMGEAACAHKAKAMGMTTQKTTP